MTFSVTYRPTVVGEPYDPESNGGQVLLLQVFQTAARTGPPLTSAGPAVKVREFLYRFTLQDLPDGTYYLVTTWTQSGTVLDRNSPVVDRTDVLRLPIRDPQLARLRGLIAEPTDAAYSDSDLGLFLDDTTREDGRADIYLAASRVWEEKSAALAARAALLGTAAQVSEVRNGDVSTRFGDQGSDLNGAISAAEKQGRYFRARSRGKTISVQSSETERAVDHAIYGAIVPGSSYYADAERAFYSDGRR